MTISMPHHYRWLFPSSLIKLISIVVFEFNMKRKNGTLQSWKWQIRMTLSQALLGYGPCIALHLPLVCRRVIGTGIDFICRSLIFVTISKVWSCLCRTRRSKRCRAEKLYDLGQKSVFCWENESSLDFAVARSNELLVERIRSFVSLSQVFY